MDVLLKKMNFTGNREIHVVNPPDTFADTVTAWRNQGFAVVVDGLDGARDVRFALGFALTRAEVDRFGAMAVQALASDALLWAAYPKGSSKRYRCEFNRDSGWDAFGEAGLEPVRQVAIDEDWSALRFRPVEQIASFTRATALTREGRRRIVDRDQPLH